MKKNQSQYPLRQALRELQFITLKGIVRWTKAIASEGVNLMALLRFAKETYPTRLALTYEEEQWSYSQLLQRAYEIASHLRQNYQIERGSKVMMCCRNHPESILTLFALSRLGADLYLLNTDLTSSQLEDFINRHSNYQLIITDKPLEISRPIDPSKVVLAQTIKGWPRYKVPQLPKARQGGIISLLTGGSSGRHTETNRKPSATAFLPPLLALLKDIGIHQRRSVYIPLPISHGFGLATLFVALVMGKEVWTTSHFSIKETIKGIAAQQIEVMVLVPTMLYRMLKEPDVSTQLSSLRTLISGGDRLTVPQAKLATTHLPNANLFNLYGTTEAGFFMLATSEDIKMAKDDVPIGRPISGVKCEIRGHDAQGVGHLWVSSGWAMAGRKGRWQDTGDLAYMDSQGLYYHRGRADRMVVCGGENIQLDMIERVITLHPHIANIKAYAIPDTMLGNSIGIDVEVKNGTELSEMQLRQWLEGQLPRRALPSLIIFKEIETTSTGKRIANPAQ